jgi:hypothetical protein
LVLLLKMTLMKQLVMRMLPLVLTMMLLLRAMVTTVD